MDHSRSGTCVRYSNRRHVTVDSTRFSLYQRSYGMTVYRTRPLPRGEIRGRYTITHTLIEETQRVLQAYYEAGREEGGHEGICYWAGRESPGMTSLEAVVVPRARHGRFSVFVSEAAFSEVARRAREMGLGILAQVHSHPGYDTRHSDGDDDLVIMPFENMLSLVAPHYGLTLKSITDFSVHQYQNHRWVLCDRKTNSASFENRYL